MKTLFAKPTGMQRNTMRRNVLAAGIATCAGMLLGSTAPAVAQDNYPSQPIRIIVPYSAGTGSDALARTVAEGITKKTGTPIVVENREGAGSLIGTQAVATAAPDGYTILIAANPMAILPSQSAKPPYDPVNDFVPVAKVAVIPLVLAVSPQLKINSVKELIDYAKANPGKLSYGSSGAGTISQQEMELFKKAVGIDVLEIPYKSTGQAMTDLIGGTLDVFPVVVPLVAPHLESGRAKGLAVFDTQRSQLLPNIPAMSEEVSVAGYTPTPVWYGFVAPAGTPQKIVSHLHDLIYSSMETEEAKARLVGIGAQAIKISNDQFLDEIKNEYQKAGELAKQLGTYK